MKQQRGYTLLELFFAIFGLLGGIGWILNIVWVIMNMTGPLTKVFILSALGIPFFPIGMILGWVHTLG